MKKSFTLILAALILASAAASCGRSDPAETTGNETNAIETTPVDTTEAETTPVETDAPETTDPWADTETVRNDKTAFDLASLTTSMGLEIRENKLYITSLKTESGVEKVAESTAYEMPSYYSFGSGSDKDFVWVYSGYTLYNDGDGGKGYTFLFEDASVSASYTLTVVARPDMAGPFEFFGNFTNNGEKTILYKPAEIFSVAVSGESAPTAWTFNKESGVAEGYKGHLSGSSYAGSGIYHTVLDRGVTATAYNTINHDWNKNGDIPMMYVDYGTSGIYYALEWTNGTLTALGEGDGSVNLSVQLANCDFETKAEVGYPVATPSVYLGVYDEDVDVGSNIFKHWFLRYKAPDNMWEDENEPLTQMDMSLLPPLMSECGFQQVTWDLGWWWAEQYYEENNGLLELRNPYHINYIQVAGASTLPEFIQIANEYGVNLTTYILLKDTGLDREGVPTSVGEFGHPEWFSVDFTIGGPSADLGDVNCVAFYKEYLYNFFNETGVSTWRSDWEPISPISYEENRHLMEGTDVTYWNTVGFGEILDYLTENLDYFRYESCSSGGSMKDFFTMTKASIINCDDSSNFMSLHMSFYDSSYCIPPSQLLLPCNAETYIEGTDHYIGIGDYRYGLRCMMTGAIMVGHTGGARVEDADYWRYYIANLYNKIMKPLIRYGDLYHILPRPDGIHWDGLQYIDADSENEIKGLVMLWKPTNEEGNEKTVYLRGLEEETLYQLTFEDRPEQNVQRTGADLMENGLTVVIEGTFGSEMIWISEVE